MTFRFSFLEATRAQPSTGTVIWAKEVLQGVVRFRTFHAWAVVSGFRGWPSADTASTPAGCATRTSRTRGSRFPPRATPGRSRYASAGKDCAKAAAGNHG